MIDFGFLGDLESSLVEWMGLGVATLLLKQDSQVGLGLVVTRLLLKGVLVVVLGFLEVAFLFMDVAKVEKSCCIFLFGNCDL